ncbi:hypothetical protein N7G274_003687 [Stereocaulon virgatum]|uniref:Uncharacterized protein n=1 Tax=Stereocaulon virgatum TaxID=373712 RepID=A0ABR4AEU3_9LECA
MDAIVGPAFGPFIWIFSINSLVGGPYFGFLTIFSGAVFLAIFISLPETRRKIIGNGSVPPHSWNMSLLSYLQLRRQRKAGIEAQQTSKIGFKARPNPLKSIYLVLQKECSFVIFYAGTLFGGSYVVLSSMPSEFGHEYSFNALPIGLCNILTGLASMLSSLINGKFLNRNFRRHEELRGMEIVDKRQ